MNQSGNNAYACKNVCKKYGVEIGWMNPRDVDENVWIKLPQKIEDMLMVLAIERENFFEIKKEVDAKEGSRVLEAIDELEERIFIDYIIDIVYHNAQF
jgi:NAD-dependent dihydropyrimidine dehydrogenase PreA subunit